MSRVVHVVSTRNFAGTERYVCDVARETASRGWDVAVVGGDPQRMRSALGDQVRWEAGATPFESLRGVARLGRQDVCHAHMTVAELIATATRPVHRAPVVSTRHFAAARGASRGGRLVAPWVASRLSREIAVSFFVADRVERRPDAVLPNGVPPSALLWNESNHTVLVLQRLECEKDTATALRAWENSRLAEDGWSLRVVGDGSERVALEARGVAGVEFAGWSADVPAELARAGILLAPAPAEPAGLVVLEAMAAGVPVVAAAGGGHLETVGLLADAPLFPPGDDEAAGEVLRGLADAEMRARLSAEAQQLVADRFTLARHVDLLLEQYGALP